MRRNRRNGQPIAVFAWDYIGLQVMLEGTYEGKFLDAAMRFLKDNRIDISGTFLDVGANIGNHALFFSRFAHRVVAFEPNDRVFQLLALNARGKAIEVHNFGLSDRSTSLAFEEYPANLGESRVVRNADIGGDYMSIEVRKFDDIEFLQEVDIDVMKVDVEFHEFEVFSGCQQMIKRCKPALIFEQMAQDIEDGTSRTLDLVRSWGYEFHYFGHAIDFPRGIRGVGGLIAGLLGDRKRFRPLRHLKKKDYNIIALPK